MSAPGQTIELAPVEAAAPPGRLAAGIERAERWLEMVGDRLNPILVKESRQSLKSRQFVITFALVLICGWAWSILGMALIGPEIYYGARGAEMFMGYFVILSFPLTIIVPFGAFRSLAAEQEDRTYELLSISTLTPAQIVAGKLAGAVLQMLVYLSAISPCLAFTYLLRGIDLPTIGLLLVYAGQYSLALSVIGLLAATLTTERHWQIVLSVFFVGGLFLAMYGACWFAGWLLFESLGMPYDRSEFWVLNGAIQTAYWSYFLMLFFAAAAQLTFASDNRTTRLRVVMVAQHVLWAAWMGWVWIALAEGDETVLYVVASVAAIHWFILGALMTGEPPELSPRVKRSLPRSFLGRMFLTWFNPGPGTGYVLAISGAVSALALVGVGVFCHEYLGAFERPWQREEARKVLCFGLLVASYASAYLGLGLLVIRFLRSLTAVSLLLTALIHALLLLAGFGLPWIIHLSFARLRMSDDYSLLHMTDPFWTPVHVIQRWGGIAPAETATLLIAIPSAALVMFVLNLPWIVREVRHMRIARPRRVVEEDAELIALRRPPQPVQISPWDVEIPSPPSPPE